MYLLGLYLKKFIIIFYLFYFFLPLTPPPSDIFFSVLSPIHVLTGRTLFHSFL